MKNTEITIDITNHLSQEEIKEVCKEQLRYEISKFFSGSEENTQRLLSNLSYKIVYNEIDKQIPNSRQIVIDKTKQILNDIQSYSVFRDGAYGGNKSLAYQYLEQAVKDNKELLNQKVKETIVDKDYSEEIWNKFESLADTFISNIYNIVELGRKTK